MMTDIASNFLLKPNFGKVTCERSWKWDTLENPLADYDLWYAWSGEGSMIINRTTHSVAKGSCFLFRAEDRTLASHNPSKPLTVTFIHFSLKQNIPWLPKPHRIVRDTFLFETYLNRYVETMIAQAFNYELEAKLLAALMLIELRKEEELVESGTESSKDPLYSVMHSIAHEVRQFPGVRHNTQSLAGRAQLSPRYFSLKFNEIMGMTLENFLIRTKIERAEHLLRYNGMNASEVADALGYKDLSFFSRQFKQVRGKTPSEIRKE